MPRPPAEPGGSLGARPGHAARSASLGHLRHRPDRADTGHAGLCRGAERGSHTGAHARQPLCPLSGRPVRWPNSGHAGPAPLRHRRRGDHVLPVPGIGKPKPYKDEYRAKLDRLAITAEQRDLLLAEAEASFRFNQAVFTNLAAAQQSRHGIAGVVPG
ncbi:MAG: hypothetical protein CSA58_03860 [Micrococcales bacterium]|nr:MAG: hypothetical protein CSA58_03860 [Micrococcales bacterium]